MLHPKVFELAVVVRIVRMKNGNGTAVARHVDTLEAGIEFDDVGSASQRQKGDGRVFVEVEYGHQLVSLTGKERAVVLRIERHTMITLALPNRIAAQDFVVRGIDDRKNVQVL